ncbi:hypothetical protein F5Y07DRAFT_371454 [Xylaria sp. FL0933]|nr:hypothetical protein F5Y07DRAFT_371454 [Xylaria sp. FL0933]
MTALPSLTDRPTRHPGCCLSLSQPLLATIRALLQSIPAAPHSPSLNQKKSSDELEPASQLAPPLILSIGSGTGLLEELLHVCLNENDGARHQTGPSPASVPTRDWRVEGVEVNHAVNIHVPEDRINQVAGTWAIHEPRARDATALMFIYPRDGALVRRYIEIFMAAEDGGRGGGGVGNEYEREEMQEGERMYDSERKGETTERPSESVNTGGKTTAHRGCQLVLWLGPKCDWEDTGFGSSDLRREFEVFEMRDGVGLAEYEMLAALRPKAAPSE